MKRIIQTEPSIGSATPYQMDEWIRAVNTGGYCEVEIPMPPHGRTGPPLGYILLYLLLWENHSIALANPSEGIHEMIEMISEQSVYVSAFRRKWPLFNSLLVNDASSLITEFGKRTILIPIQDQDDGLTKWMVGRKVAVPSRTGNLITDDELEALQSLIEPTLSLQDEFKDAYVNVASAFLHGEFEFPKDKFEKFKSVAEKVKMAMDAIDIIKLVLRK